jgi:hypothetical protein
VHWSEVQSSQSSSDGKKGSAFFSSRKLKSFGALALFAVVMYSLLFWMEAGLGSVILEESVHHAHVKEYYTVVINTFKRPDYLRDAVDHYSKCAKIKYIHVVWSEQEPPAPEVVADYNTRKLPEVSMLHVVFYNVVHVGILGFH